MEWVIGIQKTIDYIEDHITEELVYEEIAKVGFASSYHFKECSAFCADIHWESISATAG